MSEWTHYGRYHVEHCWSFNDILHKKLDYTKFLKFKTGKGDLRQKYKVGHRARLAQRICGMVMKKVLQHIIETGDIFQFPVVQGCTMKIVDKKPGFVRVILRQRVFNLAYYRNLNLFASEGRIYEMIIEFSASKKRHERKVWLNREMFDRLTELTSQGKRYLKRNA